MIRALRSHGSPGGHVESLYRDHAAEVYRYALAMLGSPADAEDATQATFLNAFRAIERGDHPRQPGAWLRTIVHNLCLQQFRLVSRRPNQVELDDEADRLFADDGGPELDDIIRALKLVPFNQRAALVMREFEGRPLNEIAEALGVSAAAVETLLFRARRSIRELLEESLTCADAELAISRQLDGLLPRAEKGRLRAHLRQCEECSRIARRLRAQRTSMQSLAVLPVPAALAWWQAGGHTGAALAGAGAGTAGAGAAGSAAPLGASVITKIAATVLASGAIGGLGYVGVQQHVIGVPFAPHGPAHAARRAAHAPTGVLSAIVRVERRHSVRPFTPLTPATRRGVHAVVFVRPPLARLSPDASVLLSPSPANPIDASDPDGPLAPLAPAVAGGPASDGSIAGSPEELAASSPGAHGGQGQGSGEGQSSSPGSQNGRGGGPSDAGGQGSGNSNGDGNTGNARGTPGGPQGAGGANGNSGSPSGGPDARGNPRDAQGRGNSAVAHAADQSGNGRGAAGSAVSVPPSASGAAGGTSDAAKGTAPGNSAAAPGASGNSGATSAAAAAGNGAVPGNSAGARANSVPAGNGGLSTPPATASATGSQPSKNQSPK